jgi:hypothetical protein
MMTMIAEAVNSHIMDTATKIAERHVATSFASPRLHNDRTSSTFRVVGIFGLARAIGYELQKQDLFITQNLFIKNIPR